MKTQRSILSNPSSISAGISGQRTPYQGPIQSDNNENRIGLQSMPLSALGRQRQSMDEYNHTITE